MTERKNKIITPRFAAIMFIAILTCLAAAMGDFLNNFGSHLGKVRVLESGSFQQESDSTETTTKKMEKLSTKKNAIDPSDFTTKTVNSDEKYSGPLILVNDKLPYKGKTDTFDTFENEANLNHSFYVSTYKLRFQKEVLPQLLNFTAAYSAQFKKADIYLANTTSDQQLNEYCADTLPERDSGYCFDIILRLKTGKKQPLTDNLNSVWIRDNAWKYGFIQRYPKDKTDKTGVDFKDYHFRYVGRIPASYMKENNLCLEEFLDRVKRYSYEDPLIYQKNSRYYELYYTKAQDGQTKIPVPQGYTENDYRISGNNLDGFITTIAIKKN